MRVSDPHSHRAAGDRPRPPRWPERIVAAMRLRYATWHERSPLWRSLAPLVFLAAGVLFVASAISSGGTDLRPGRYDDLADLAQSRSDRVAALDQERAELQAEIDQLTKNQTGAGLKQARAQLAQLQSPAGLEPVSGPGVTVTLNDAPRRVLNDGQGDIKRKIVHQQDIQAVANALWAAGAEAVTVQGQRIVSTTGIKCVGNSVLLQGVAYSPPYVIAGIGDPDAMLARIDSDPAIALYLRDVADFQLGWDVEVSDQLKFPAYAGSIDTQYAQPLELDGHPG
jgi:uncharacterized protein YlxW (UPF0749 family)